MAKDSGQVLAKAIQELGDVEGFDSSVGGDALDLRYGGLNGILPNIGREVDGIMYGGWISNTPATTGIVHAVLIDYPKFFDMCGSEAATKLKGMLSALVSTHAEVIEGINDTTTLEYSDDAKIGYTQESVQQVIKAAMEVTSPSMTFTEKYGLPIRKLLTFIQRYGIADVYTQNNLAFLLPDYKKTPWLSNMQSFAIMVYETDPQGTIVTNAQIVANMMPMSTGEFVFKKDISSSKEVKKYTIQFTGFGIRGNDVITKAQTYVDAMMESTKAAFLSTSLYDGPVSGLSNSAIDGTLNKTNTQL